MECIIGFLLGFAICGAIWVWYEEERRKREIP